MMHMSSSFLNTFGPESDKQKIFNMPSVQQAILMKEKRAWPRFFSRCRLAGSDEHIATLIEGVSKEYYIWTLQMLGFIKKSA